MFHISDSVNPVFLGESRRPFGQTGLGEQLNMAVSCLLYNIKIYKKYLPRFLGATHLTVMNE